MKKISESELGRIAAEWNLSEPAFRVLASDNGWQQRARLLQIGWARELLEEDHSLEINTDHPWKIASTPDSPYLGDANFLTPTIAEEVRLAQLPQPGQPDQVMEKVRLRSNLLSSQPLCFNAFGELSAPGRLDDAAAVLSQLWPDLVGQVTGIRYEHNPHRGAQGLSGTESAFDVFIDCLTPDGELAFVGIEVKYHESMNDTAPVKEAKREEIRAPRRRALQRSAPGWVATWTTCSRTHEASARSGRSGWTIPSPSPCSTPISSNRTLHPRVQTRSLRHAQPRAQHPSEGLLRPLRGVHRGRGPPRETRCGSALSRVSRGPAWKSCPALDGCRTWTAVT